MIESMVEIRRMNSWRLGSTVRYYAEPRSEEELLSVLDQAKQTKHGPIFLGLGSNVLFPDEILDACMIRTKYLSHLVISGNMVEAQCGVTLAKLGKNCAKSGMKDAVFLVGIPGMLGGALRMNAGAHQHSIWDYVVSVKAVTDKGIQCLTPDDFEIGYRHVRYLSGTLYCFLSATMEFRPQCANMAHDYMKDLINKRNAVQPIGTFNCGCVFKNLPNHSVGRTLDRVGLRGYQVGHARISPIHANFIENVEQKASTKDVWALIHIMQDQMYQQTGQIPQLEVVTYD